MRNSSHGDSGRASSVEDADILTLCTGSVVFHGSLTLGAESDAPTWFREIFLPHIAPAFARGHALALAGTAREVIAIDQALSAPLPAFTGVLASAGRRLLAAQDPSRGDRVLRRYAAFTQDGTAPGHLPIVFALRAAAFHVPLRQALLAYVQTEAMAAFGDEHVAWLQEAMIFWTALPPGNVQLHAA